MEKDSPARPATRINCKAAATLAALDENPGRGFKGNGHARAQFNGATAAAAARARSKKIGAGSATTAAPLEVCR